MADDEFDDTVRPESALAQVLWLIGAAGIHLFLWSVLLFLLYIYVPRQKEVFEDFGVAISMATMAVIHLSDFVVDDWFLVVPLVMAMVLLTDGLVVFLCRWAGLRVAFLVLLMMPPIALSVVSFIFPQHDVAVLMDQLG